MSFSHLLTYEPCAQGTTTTTMAPITPTTCAAKGCIYGPGSCQCDNACVDYNDCCSDYASVCAPTTPAATTPAPTVQTYSVNWTMTMTTPISLTIHVGDTVNFVWVDPMSKLQFFYIYPSVHEIA